MKCRIIIMCNDIPEFFVIQGIPEKAAKEFCKMKNETKKDEDEYWHYKQVIPLDWDFKTSKLTEYEL